MLGCRQSGCKEGLEIKCITCNTEICVNHHGEHINHNILLLGCFNVFQALKGACDSTISSLRQMAEKFYTEAVQEINEIMEVGKRITDCIEKIQGQVYDIGRNPNLDQILTNIIKEGLLSNIRCEFQRPAALVNSFNEFIQKIIKIADPSKATLQNHFNISIGDIANWDQKDHCFNLNDFAYSRTIGGVLNTNQIIQSIAETIIINASYKKDIESFEQKANKICCDLGPISQIISPMILPQNNSALEIIINRLSAALESNPRENHLMLLRKVSEMFDVEIFVKDEITGKLVNFHRANSFLKLFLVKKDSYWESMIPKKNVYSYVRWERVFTVKPPPPVSTLSMNNRRNKK